MANLLVGQIETLLPELLEAIKQEKTAKAEVLKQKKVIADLIGNPQTIKTVWGAVTLNNGRRTVKVTDKALNAQITLLKETGVVEGKCEVNHGDPFITVKVTDR